MFTRRSMMAAAAFATLVAAVPALGRDLDKAPSRAGGARRASFIHAHEQATKAGPKVIQFKMTIQEKELVIDNEGTKIHAMTFNGSVPGPLMVVHQDDYVELTLVNPETNTMAHNIDFHSATGGRAAANSPWSTPASRPRCAARPTGAGVFVYHCAPGGAMIPWHVTSGMNGAVMVLPRDGLKDRDRQAAALRQGLLYRRAGLLRSARREGASSRAMTAPGRPIPTRSR